MSERRRPEPRAAYRWFREVGLHWRDNDVYGHVNNVVHYAWFDTTVNAWLLEQGFLRRGSGVAGFVVASGCDYFAEVAFPARVDCGLRADHIGTCSVRYALALFRQGEALSLAAGQLTHAYVRWPERRPAPLPADLRERLAALRAS